MMELREGAMGKHSRQSEQPVQRPWGSNGPGVLEECEGACVSGADRRGRGEGDGAGPAGPRRMFW